MNTTKVIPRPSEIFYFKRIADSESRAKIIYNFLKEKVSTVFAESIDKEIKNPEVSRSRMLFQGQNPLGAVVFSSSKQKDESLSLENALQIRNLIVIAEDNKELVYQKLIEKVMEEGQKIQASSVYLLANNQDETVAVCQNNGFKEDQLKDKQFDLLLTKELVQIELKSPLTQNFSFETRKRKEREGDKFKDNSYPQIGRSKKINRNQLLKTFQTQTRSRCIRVH